MKTKILIIRFSSIGDIVLTSPVVRVLGKNPDIELHFVVKSKFVQVLENNPYLTKIHSFNKEIDEVIDDLKSEKFDLIIDLHTNLRSWRLSRKLGVGVRRFSKLNVRKWVLVNLKWNLMPQKHIVDRYFEAVPVQFGTYDGLGLDYFSGIDKQSAMAFLPKNSADYHVFVVGGAHFTKQIPSKIFIDLANKSPLPVVLIGSADDKIKADEIALNSKNCINLCGQLTLNQSAAMVQYAQKVITGDTGLMHIAAAYNKEIHSFWGNTVPAFGMTPFAPDQSKIHQAIYEVKNLKCRPCSKIGFDHCPKKHFKCMLEIDYSAVFTDKNRSDSN